jgi:hypothetical protein
MGGVWDSGLPSDIRTGYVNVTTALGIIYVLKYNLHYNITLIAFLSILLKWKQYVAWVYLSY